MTAKTYGVQRVLTAAHATYYKVDGDAVVHTTGDGLFCVHCLRTNLCPHVDAVRDFQDIGEQP